MSPNLSDLEQRAAQLPIDERSQLAFFLLESLEPADAGDVDEVWRDEAEARLAAIERDEASLLPAEEVFEKLRRRSP